MVDVVATRRLRLVPRVKLRGTQLAGWVPRVTPAASKAGMTFQEDVRIPLPDGTVLLADLFLPVDGLPAPVLLAWAVYHKDTERMGGGPLIDESGASTFFTARGYAVLRVQPRGTGRSQGEPPTEMFGATEVQDCYDTIEWAAGQGWCNGQVAMTGMSAFSVIQLLVAARRPPHLAGIFPYKSFTDIYRHGFFKGGASYTGAVELFAAFEKTPMPHLPPGLRHAVSYLLNRPPFLKEMSNSAGNQRVNRRVMRLVTPPEAACRTYVERVFDNPFDNEHWRDRSATASLTEIRVPLCIGTDYGAVGFHLFGAFELWHRGTGDKRMFIGPPEYTFPWSNYHEEAAAWYDWQLKGIDNGYADLPPVRYWLSGAERWQSAVDWPLPDAVRTRLHLENGSSSALGEQKLSPNAPAHDGSQSFLAIPSTSYYPHEIDRYETQLLRYSTDPFPSDTQVVGPLHLHLVLSASAIDTYVMVRLSDVAPAGTRRKLAFGWLLASHRHVDEQRSNPTEIVHDHSAAAARQLVPGQPTVLDLSLTPVSHQFRVGHRMLLEVGSRPELLCPEKGEGFDMFLWDPVPYRSRNHVHHGPDGSWLEVDILSPGSSPPPYA